jgi:hypothetical protein
MIWRACRSTRAAPPRTARRTPDDRSTHGQSSHAADLHDADRCRVGLSTRRSRRKTSTP